MRVSAQAVSEGENWTTMVAGTTTQYLDLNVWPVREGSPFSQTDEDEKAKIALIGETAAAHLYPPEVSPIGHTVRIKGIPFRITGLLSKKGHSHTGGDMDDVIILPASTYTTLITGGQLREYMSGMTVVILVEAKTREDAGRAEREVTAVLRDRHHLPPGASNDFSVRNLAEAANATEAGAKAVASLLASIAAVSLIVGGIGIMNIMLVSVNQRTREIGLRIAIGAKPRHILLQFLVEALTLATLGGVVGLALGLIGAARAATSFGWPLMVRPEILLLAIGFSAGIGLAFGLYPARKASLLDPIEALRYE
jgi:putative ABC transport system permease protein